MVAVLITAVVVTALYSISRSATATFNQQQRTAEMQLRLRFAMEQLRADIDRAGFMATPNSMVDWRVCPKPSVVLQAVEIDRDPSPPIPNPTNNSVTPIILKMIGNYASQDEYLVAAITGSTIYLQNQTPQWARIPNVTEFNRIFVAPSGQQRMIRIVSTNGQAQFLQVTAGMFSPTGAASLPTLTVLSPPTLVGDTPAGGASAGLGCGLPGMGVGSTVAPISMVQYSIANLSATQPQDYPLDPTLVPLKTDLVRREFNLNPAPIAIPGTDRLVGEYAVDFDAQAAVDDGTPAGSQTGPVSIRTIPFGSNVPVIAGQYPGTGALPQRLRALTIRLSIRERDQDPTFGFVARAATDPLTRFQVRPPTWPGASRVRTLQADIVLPNLAIRNLR